MPTENFHFKIQSFHLKFNQIYKTNGKYFRKTFSSTLSIALHSIDIVFHYGETQFEFTIKIRQIKYVFNQKSNLFRSGPMLCKSVAGRAVEIISRHTIRLKSRSAR